MEQLHPRVQIVWGMSTLISAIVVGAVGVAVGMFWLEFGPLPGIGLAVMVFIIGVIHLVFRYRIWQFEVRDEELYIQHGVLTRVTTLVPYVRVQHVDTRRSPVERAVGLGSVVVYTAGSRGSDVTIPGLTRERAESLQRQLRDLAIESERSDAV